jgi:FAD/FMN-containing dehydrogenase
MTRFNRISKYVPGEKFRDVGAGCLFDEVYRAIVPTGQNIVGGSAIAGVGIAGWLLGGGYSLKTNQYGLGIDNLEGFTIVLPNGAIENVTEQSNRELFEAVKVRVCLSCGSYVFHGSLIIPIRIGRRK